MSNPRISVVIPTCHRNDLLALCLDALAPGAQSLDASAYEIIVTDDGSLSTAQAMMAEKYAWARWVAGPRRGPAANRNYGALMARGEFVAFTDDDCLPTRGWVGAYADSIADEFEVYEGATKATKPFRGPLAVAPINEEGGLLWSCNMMVKSQLFDATGGFDEGFPHASDEDTDFRERVKSAGYALRFVPDALIYHPPVRRPWGRSSAQQWQSKVRLAYKADPARPAFTRRELVWYALRTRTRQILGAPWHLDKLLGLYGMIIELIWIARHTRSWDRKHRALLLPKASVCSEPE